LGDLSRYRETELVTGKQRNWGPAIGYYDLASIINPASGASHNQLAVIALEDANHLRATYHLYRALSAQEPYPTAKRNLELEFRKILSAWAKRELIPREDAGIPGKALTPWFVYLHTQCYKGLDFQEHDELENEVLSQLAVDLKERSLEGTLQKFVLINIAAEDFAKVRSSDEQTDNAQLFFQRINVKTFFTLLQILLAELERFATEDCEAKEPQHGSEKVTAVARRVLPALRNYSSWLLTNCGSLEAQKQDKDTALSVQIQEFWKIYANTLTLLASTFDVTSLPEVEYLLEEDEETLGFKPLLNDATSRRYLSETGDKNKPRMLDPGIERNHPNIEMLYRIREFVIDGLDLVVSSVSTAQEFISNCDLPIETAHPSCPCR
jgi:Est1 DNA/RNA binding domain